MLHGVGILLTNYRLTQSGGSIGRIESMSMYDYKAPLRDIQFIYNELYDYQAHLAQFPKYEEVTADLVDAIIKESAKFAEEVVAPLNRNSDEEGCHWEDGQVFTPKGFKEAYQQYQEAGWPSLDYDVEMGGQGLPESLNIATMEFKGAASWSWSSLIGFGHAGAKTVMGYGSQELQDMFLPKTVTGEWLGTMCLTEAHCGTDLGLMKTKAEPNSDGTYSITGTKIFITSGEHDLSENIVHIVLARVVGAPEGTSGISVFVVPKFNVENGEIADRNAVHCGSIEHKMGIKGSATCVMNFDGAKGYLIGQENQGLRAMFLMMNAARIGTGIQGLCHMEVGLQKSVGYARDRLQMRSLKGPANPDGAADPIIVHPDVRRMLMTQKALAEGGRMLVAYNVMLVDQENDSEDEEVRKSASRQLEFLTPIIKAFLTETGFESASLAVQCFGGHGYIREWGVEQNLRDSRIAMLYEGTTGVQALDLLGRKVLGSQGEMMKPFANEIRTLCKQNPEHKLVQQLAAIAEKWSGLTQTIGMAAMKNPEEVGSASVDYLMFSGYVVLAYFWAKAAICAEEKLSAGESDSDFYDAKIKTAQFYFDRLLPRTKSLAQSIANGGDSMMSMSEDQFLCHI